MNINKQNYYYYYLIKIINDTQVIIFNIYIVTKIILY